MIILEMALIRVDSVLCCVPSDSSIEDGALIRVDSVLCCVLPVIVPLKMGL